MRLTDLHADAAMLSELDLRLARHRPERNWTQSDLAREAGAGRATVQRLESGRSAQTTSLVKVLRTLALLEGLDAAIPESAPLPIAAPEREQRWRRRRYRARQPISAAGGPSSLSERLELAIPRAGSAAAGRPPHEVLLSCT
ncbi:MAG TPA: helix-turn-helix transcriptional regulator [Solirubrobacteraceae bacterium]|nr:helix-turn-helix transcriptional regulator [Solirubrobacteraceae bacterium]